MKSGCDGWMPKGGWQEFSSAESLQRPSGPAAAPTAKAQQMVRVQPTRGGKGGKTVTVIRGLELDAAGFKALLKKLKTRIGSGGTCLLYTSPSPRDMRRSRMPSSA